MTQEHPITPPGELVQKWVSQMITPEEGNLALDFDWLANKAARWGADQELEACCEWLRHGLPYESHADYLRNARRPKPSLKERALAVVENLIICEHLSKQDETTLLDALESLSE